MASGLGVGSPPGTTEPAKASNEAAAVTESSIIKLIDSGKGYSE